MTPSSSQSVFSLNWPNAAASEKLSSCNTLKQHYRHNCHAQSFQTWIFKDRVPITSSHRCVHSWRDNVQGLEVQLRCKENKSITETSHRSESRFALLFALMFYWAHGTQPSQITAITTDWNPPLSPVASTPLSGQTTTVHHVLAI